MMAYGEKEDGSARCTNAEPGTFGHECGRPASWIGKKESGFTACFCEECKRFGYEARRMIEWRAI